MRRGLLGFTLIATSCVTVNGEQRFVSTRPMPASCSDEVITGALEPTRRAVRFVFTRHSRCSDAREATYEEQRSLMMDPTARTIVSGAAAASVMIPWMVTVQRSLPQVSAYQDRWYPPEATHEKELLRGIGVWVLTLIPVAIAGAATHWATGAVHVPIPSVEHVVRDWQDVEGPISEGEVNGHVLEDGVLALTLDDIDAFVSARLELDGKHVDIKGHDVTRLAALPECRAALEASAPGEARYRHASACAAGGWAFADDVLRKLEPGFVERR